MSYKTEFQSNNADLQGLIDLANSLPEAENLDTELTTQDDLIAQIAAALEGKTTGGVSLPELNNPVTADIIPSGFEAIDGLGALMVGTGTGLGDATAADVASGKTFTSKNGLKLTGNASIPQIQYVNVTVSNSMSSGGHAYNSGFTIPLSLPPKNSCKIYGGCAGDSYYDTVIACGDSKQITVEHSSDGDSVKTATVFTRTSTGISVAPYYIPEKVVIKLIVIDT